MDNIRKKPMKYLIIMVASSAIFIAIMYYLTQSFVTENVSSRIEYALFLAALAQVCTGLGVIVRNGGVFKTMSFIPYYNKKVRTRKKIRDGELPKDADIGSFADYVNEKYQNPWPTMPFFAGAVLLAVVYAVMQI